MPLRQNNTDETVREIYLPTEILRRILIVICHDILKIEVSQSHQSLFQNKNKRNLFNFIRYMFLYRYMFAPSFCEKIEKRLHLILFHATKIFQIFSFQQRIAK